MWRAPSLQWPPERAAAVCGIPAEQVRSLARDYGTTQPAAIRLNYGMQRVRGGGNAARADRAACRAWSAPGAHRAGGLLLSASGWFRACATTPRCSGPTCSAGRRPRTINMSTIGDDLLRRAASARRRPRFGPRIEALVVYNSNPVAVAPESAQGRARASRARTCSRSCSSTS